MIDEPRIGKLYFCGASHQQIVLCIRKDNAFGFEKQATWFWFFKSKREYYFEHGTWGMLKELE